MILWSVLVYHLICSISIFAHNVSVSKIHIGISMELWLIDNDRSSSKGYNYVIMYQPLSVDEFTSNCFYLQIEMLQ
jgi:hypothetical protein